MILSPLSRPAVAADLPLLSAEPLDLVGLLAKSHHPEAGAIVLFSGEVRDNDPQTDVDYLEYEAQEVMASKSIRQILDDACKKFPLKIALAQHRTGKVGISESAVVVITASPHRAEAYSANRYIIDRIKHESPIWKCEYFKDGTKEWGGNCNCQKITGDANKHVYEWTEGRK